MSTPIDRRKITNYDEVLFSGSSDPLRTALGLYYEVVYASGSNNKLVESPIPSIEDTTSFFVNEQGAYALDNTFTDKIIYIQTNPDLVTTASSNTVLETRRFPVRIIGNNAEDVIKTNEQWKTILLGGTYETNTYEPLISQGVFNDFTFTYDMPYSSFRARELSSVLPDLTPESLTRFEITYTYNEYLPEFQNASTPLSELLLPNVYMLKTVDDATTPSVSFANYITDFVSLGDSESLLINGDATNSLFDTVKQYYPPPYAVISKEIDTTTDPERTMYEDKSYNIREYLTGAFVNNTLSDETVGEILRKGRNLFFSTNSSDLLKDVNKNIHKMPMYATIKFPVNASRTDGYSEIIRNNNLDEDILLYIKNNFPNVKNDYLQLSEELTGSYTTDETTEEVTYNYNSNVEGKSIKTQNLLSALVNIYNSTTNQNIFDNTFMGERTLASISSENPDSKYRYYKAAKALKAIEQTTQRLNSSLNSPSGNPVETMQKLTSMVNAPFSDQLQSGDTIAYKLTKLGGSFLDSERRITSIQDFYFMNSDNALMVDGTDFIYHDTQVKYGEQYYYTLTAYVIVSGYEYQYSDLRISRNIGEVVVRDETEGTYEVTTDKEKYCTEMYDPTTGNSVEQLLNTETNLMGEGTLVAIGADDQSSDQMNLFRQHYLGLGVFDKLKWSDLLDVHPIVLPGESYILNVPALGISLDVNLEDYVHDYFGEGTNYKTATADYHVDWDMGADRYLDLSDSNQQLEIELYKLWATKRVYSTEERTFLKADDSRIVDIQISQMDSTSNRFATNSQFKSRFKFCADFNFSMAPAARIVEIPLATKVLTILDNPPVAPDITPFSRVDDSQTVGFFVNLESFRLPQNPTNTDSESTIGMYPTPMGTNEQLKRERYLTSHDMLSDDLVMEDSVSKVNRLEIYRIDRMPTSLDDFIGNLVFTKNLSIGIKEKDRNYFTNCIYEERIQTNKKYYYFLRFLNENNESSYFAPIQIVELVDDGGYKYPIFDVMFESQLTKPKPTQDNTIFKKLMQITPDIKHMIVDDSMVDYTQPAATQVDKLTGMIGKADDLLWGKTFKFRITSKKTGKKIDLNIKYNLRDS